MNPSAERVQSGPARDARLRRARTRSVTSLFAIGLLMACSRDDTDARLVRADPAEALDDARLLGRAMEIARPSFREHCAGCHGPELQGSGPGVPNLARHEWLYGDEPVEVERTILYGIRSGHPKGRNLTDMPPLVRSGQITASEAREVVEYLEGLAGKPHDPAMAEKGHAVYDTKGNCFDCHAPDARGIVDYGAPALTGPDWLYGGDRAAIFESIAAGRHGICPAWIGRLSALEIRSLTLYLVHVSRTSPGSTRH